MIKPEAAGGLLGFDVERVGGPHSGAAAAQNDAAGSAPPFNIPRPAGATIEMERTVLCIEDHPLSMYLVEAMLSALPQLRLVKAFNGSDGIRLAKTERPDLVLLDMHLPDIGGIEVVRALSELISRDGLRIVLLTADSFSVDIVKAMSLGAHEYWPKPLAVEKAMGDLQRLLQRAPGLEPEASPL
jgi:CheY-like chemotaxis protein